VGHDAATAEVAGTGTNSDGGGGDDGEERREGCGTLPSVPWPAATLPRPAHRALLTSDPLVHGAHDMHAHVLVGRGKRTSHLSEQTLLAVLQYVRGDILAAQRGSRGAVADSLHAQSYKWMATIQVSCILYCVFF
jgi:hypothetical protein